MQRSVLPTLTLTAAPETGAAIRFDDEGDRLRLTADAELHGVASGLFDEPRTFVSFPALLAGGAAQFVGYSFAQFAMPVVGDTNTPFNFAPAANVDSPATVIPLLIRAADGTVCLMAPLDSWHEQAIAVVQSDSGIQEFRWGWHGDVDHLGAGSTVTLGVYEGTSVEALFERWGADIGAPDVGLARRSDPVTTHLSYWTDNGAAYWYRTEPGSTVDQTLAEKLAELRALGVGVRSVELDSWFYPHEVSRPVSDVGYLDEVPPTGMLEWQPRSDTLPDGMEALADKLGRPPLVLHSRHISARSPYLDDGEWWVDVSAHPVDQSFFERWMADAAAWGATCVEQDWMLMNWFGVRQLRAEPGRSMAWQHGLDDAAAAHDLTLIWCMPTPGDLMATVELNRIVAVRTCDDYRYAADPARLWRWYLTVNRLARSLRLPVSKDCFFTGADPGETGLDGDVHVEVEALLSAMSAGIAGIGDRIGRTDTAIIDRLCRPDGLLVQPDRPLALADRSFFSPATPEGVVADELTWATTESGPWRYVVAIHTAVSPDQIGDTFTLDDEYLIYDWRNETATVGSQCEASLGYRDWALFVCCPLTDSGSGEVGRQAIIGDATKYATMGRSRIVVDTDGGSGGDGATYSEPVVSAAVGEDGVSVRRWNERRGLFDQWVSAEPS